MALPKISVVTAKPGEAVLGCVHLGAKNAKFVSVPALHKLSETIVVAPVGKLSKGMRAEIAALLKLKNLNKEARATLTELLNRGSINEAVILNRFLKTK